MNNRRQFLATAIAAPIAASTVNHVSAASPERPPSKKIQLAIATYSYWHFRTEKVPIEVVMDKAADLGVAAVDILHRQMELDELVPLDASGRAYLHKLEPHAFRNGLGICCLSMHQSFI